MDDRIQRALDGELARADLTPAEVAQLEEQEALFAGVLRAMPAPPLPQLGDAVVARIANRAAPSPAPARARELTPRRPFARAFAWLWSPTRISIALRPAYAFAAAALVIFAAGIGIGSRLHPAPSNATVAATTAAQQRPVLVQFRLAAPDAHTVSLAGDFSNWKPSYSLTRSAPGLWTIVVPLQPGVHDYSFVVDGDEWKPDPTAPATADGFGGMNSRIAVLSSDATSAL
jgi:hypothetical protein